MPLTIAERKHRMPFGAQKRVADRFEVAPSYISAVMNDEVHPKTPPTKERLRLVQLALSEELGERVEEVFPQTTQEAPPMAEAS